MNRRLPALVLWTAIALAACSTDVVAPIKVPTGPNFAISAGNLSGSYVVLMKGIGIANGFADRVGSLGGTVTYANEKAGFATVSGLTDVGAAQLGALSGVGEVQADAVVALDAPLPAASADASGVGDPSVDSQMNPALAALGSWQWNMQLIGARYAWAAAKLGSSTVSVAILDTGIDYDSRDLNGLVDPLRSTSFMSTYVLGQGETVLRPADDTVRKYFFPSRKVFTDFNGHGTNVASQVSSKAGVFAGVTSKTTLIAVKVLGSNGVGTFGQILSGVLYAADQGADVANMSLGGGFSKAGNGRLVGAINKVFDYAKQQGMLIVVSAGNSSADLQHDGNLYASFCDAPHVVCVSSVGPPTSTGNPDTPAFYTNFGRSVISVASPGGNANPPGFTVSHWPWGNDIASWVWSFCAKNRLAGFTAANAPRLAGCQNGRFITGYIGTSQASPHVAGLAALLIAENGKGNPQQIKQLMEQSGDPIDPAYGRSRISVKNALGL
jgi:hypothetical protein